MDEKAKERSIDDCLCRMRDGDTAALAPLYDCTHRQLYSLCYSYFRNRADSEDALSETYLHIQTNAAKFKGSGGYMWISTMAKNICLNMLKRERRAVSVDFTDEATENFFGERMAEPPETNAEGNELAELAKSVLNEKEFRIVILHAVSGQKFRAIAELVGGLETTVRWQYNNALKKLRKECERRRIR